MSVRTCAIILGVSYILMGIYDFFDIYGTSHDVLGNPYMYLVALTALLGVVLLIKNDLRAEHIMILVVITEMVIEAGYYLLYMDGADDLEFMFNFMKLAIFGATLFFLFMYVVGFRHNARRLVGTLLILCVILALELVLEFFYIKDPIAMIVEYWMYIPQLLVYAILILLLGNIRISDTLPNKRISVNSSAIFKSMDGGDMAYISREDYEDLLSGSDDGWHTSTDPDIESEKTIEVRYTRGRYDLVLQRRHGSDTIHAILHVPTSGSILNALVFDIVHIESMGRYCRSEKIRIFGYDGMFVDLLVGKPDKFRVMPEYT